MHSYVFIPFIATESCGLIGQMKGNHHLERGEVLLSKPQVMIYLFASLLKLECLEELLSLITYACQVDFALESFSASHSMPSSYPHWK